MTPLDEYARKRKFDQTPEPPPAEPARKKKTAGGGRFYIQRHDATRLHYDLRLEIGGTLKSWAVPKGPSLVPLSKNLAMHVEDHPLDYGEFEGNIPKGNYGAGSVMLWDRGTFDQLGEGTGEDQIERGDLKFRLHGEKVKGEFALIRMKGRSTKGNEWLLIKKRDAHADPTWDTEEHAWSVKTGRSQEEIAKDLPAKQEETPTAAAGVFDPAALQGARKAAMPRSLEPMKAQIAEEPPRSGNWLYEIKWDGVRALCFVEEGRVRLCSRTGNTYDRQFPELLVLPNFVHADTAILDGEIGVLDDTGRSRFELIQPRIHQTDPNSIAHLARKTPVRLWLFDLLYLDGFDLRGVPLEERKRALAAVVEPNDTIRLSDHFSVSGKEMLQAAKQMNLEGIMAKQSGSKYESRRSNCWLKIKITRRQEFVICGYTEGERDTFASLVLGVHRDGQLEWAGNVGTGFNERTLRDLHAKMQPLIRKTPPFAKRDPKLVKATWIEPVLVCECKYLEWTREGRLRAPVYMGLREDKKASEVIVEMPAAGPAPEDRPDEPLFSADAKEKTLRIDGRSIKFTNLNKVWFPNDGYTKRDVLNYYDAVADLIIPHLRDRPLSLKRYPNGIHQEFFFQKNIPDVYPEWLRIEPIHSEHRGEPIRYVIANDRSTLLYLTNLGCIDQNPWMSRIGTLENPDYVLIDLDPVSCSFDKIVQAALLVKEVLDDIGLAGYPKTTGGDGMHVYVPIEPKYTYEQARSFGEILSQLVIARNKSLFTTPRAVAKRQKNRVYFDYLQLSLSETIAATYVVRAHDGAPVATPLDWAEVKKGLTPQQFHIRNAVERFRQVGDLFEPVLTQPQKLEPALRRLSSRLAATE
jgi:bifunctional non-homologous end joining protein LigD